MQDDGDTSGSHRGDRPKTETNLIIPLDLLLHDMKRDTARELKDIKNDLGTIEGRQHEARIDGLKQDQQIQTNAIDIQRDRKYIESIGDRVKVLEDSARDAKAIADADAKGMIAQMMSGGLSGIGSLIAAGIGALILWLLTQYFKGTPP